MNPIINASIQAIPINVNDSYFIVDKAIAVIQASGLPFKVGPFSTSVEGTLKEVQTLIGKITEACQEYGANELLLNLQFHIKADKDVRMDDKTGKYVD